MSDVGLKVNTGFSDPALHLFYDLAVSVSVIAVFQSRYLNTGDIIAIMMFPHCIHAFI